MQCLVLYSHYSEGTFPTFKAGTKLGELLPCQKYQGWYSTTYNNVEFFVYGGFVDENNTLIVDYNSTELEVHHGDMVEVLGLYQGWIWVKITSKHNNQGSSVGQIGWLPNEIVQSCYTIKDFNNNQ